MIQLNNETQTWTEDQIDIVFEAAKARLDDERREMFTPFGVPIECYWPASRVFHRHSCMGPETKFRLTMDEVDTFTRRLDYKQYPGAERIPLPRTAEVARPFEQVIRKRQSEREYAPGSVRMQDLTKLLELSCGVTKHQEIPRRAAPSPGGLYAVEAYPMAFAVEGLQPGIYHYSALSHALELVRLIPGIDVMAPFLPPDLYAAKPPLVLALSVVFPRVQIKYLERGYRFALLEAGHIAQNMLLTATALGLASAPVGGFWDEPFNDLLGFDGTTEAVIYCVLVGNRD